MDPCVGHLRQPAAYVLVGGLYIQLQPGLFERGGQRHDEALLEIAIEALDLALGLGPIGTAYLRREAIALG